MLPAAVHTKVDEYLTAYGITRAALEQLRDGGNDHAHDATSSLLYTADDLLRVFSWHLGGWTAPSPQRRGGGRAAREATTAAEAVPIVVAALEKHNDDLRRLKGAVAPSRLEILHNVAVPDALRRKYAEVKAAFLAAKL